MDSAPTAGPPSSRPYHRRVPSYALVALVGAIALLVLIPTRRLFLIGWSGRSLWTYFLGVVVLGLVVAELRAPARYLIPILVIAYIAPFVTARDGVRRLLGRTPVGGQVRVRRADAPTLPEPPRVVRDDDREAAAARPVGPSEPREQSPDTGPPDDEEGDR
jgi:hypothetical protein